MHSKRSANSYDEPLIYSKIKRPQSSTAKRPKHLIDNRSRDSQCLCEHEINTLKNKKYNTNNSNTDDTSPYNKSLYSCEQTLINWFSLHNIRLCLLSRECERWKTIGDEIDPENLNSNKWYYQWISEDDDTEC